MTDWNQKHHLFEKLSKKSKQNRAKVNKRKLSRSVEEHSSHIDNRKGFGHRQCDLVLGAKNKDDKVLLTMIERMTREFLIIPLANKNTDTVLNVFYDLKTHYEENFNEVFKTITTDNGSGFADLSNLETVSETLVYYAHPYTSCE